MISDRSDVTGASLGQDATRPPAAPDQSAAGAQENCKPGLAAHHPDIRNEPPNRHAGQYLIAERAGRAMAQSARKGLLLGDPAAVVREFQTDARTTGSAAITDVPQSAAASPEADDGRVQPDIVEPYDARDDTSNAAKADTPLRNAEREPRGDAGEAERTGRRVRWLSRDIEQAESHLTVQVAGTLTGLPVSSLIGREVARMLGVLAPTLATGASVVLHVTSAAAGAGVSTVARELAATGNVLPACRPLLLCAKAHAPAFEPGMGTVLPDLLAAYRSKLVIEVMDVQTVRSSFHAAHVVTEPGAALVNPTTTIRPVDDLWAGLQRAYNLIVVDCQPVSGLLGFLPIAKRPPQVLLVVSAGATRAGDAVRARVLIERMGGQLVGAVMNHNTKLEPRSSPV